MSFENRSIMTIGELHYVAPFYMDIVLAGIVKATSQLTDGSRQSSRQHRDQTEHHQGTNSDNRHDRRRRCDRFRRVD